MECPKCTFPDGAKITLFGEELDPCDYREAEFHENVNVSVSYCKFCGNPLIEWYRRPETKSTYYQWKND